jgi:AcrR family transcriptional regulator
MPRSRPETRIEDLIHAATSVFLEKGYRRAQVADIADAMGVAPGTIYLYVESKEALFDAVMRASTSPEILKTVHLPIKTPVPGDTLSFIEMALSSEARIGSLEAALKARDIRDASIELEEIARELYTKAARSWLALKLLERSALDWPELAALWFGKYRLRLLQQLTRYFDMRMASGALRKVPDPPAVAGLVLEMVAAFCDALPQGWPLSSTNRPGGGC